MTSKFFLKNMLVVIMCSLFVLGCFTGPPEKTVHVSSLLNGDILCTKITIKQYQAKIGGAEVPIGITLKVVYRKTGKYKIQMWQTTYRSNDIMSEVISENITAAPIERIYKLNEDFYRLEIAQVTNNKLNTDSCEIGKGNGGWGKVLPIDKNYKM